jgi:DNA polymerase (family 10)
MHNEQIASSFDELADLYELDGAIVHRVVAYRNAANSIRNSGRSVEELANSGGLEQLAGVGKTIADKVRTLLETGTIPSADKLKAKYPPGLIEVTHLPGIGPKRARKLHEELGIDSLESLRQAVESETLRGVSGFGKKAEENIALALEQQPQRKERGKTLLPRVLEVAQELVDGLRQNPATERAEIAGSARRLTETSKDIDLVASSTDATSVSEAFCQLDAVASVESCGESGARVTTNGGLSVDLRIVHPMSFGNLLLHLTGSGRHNEALRTDAVRHGFHLSEYGLTDPDGLTHAATDEADIYRMLGLDYIEPELRENRGELQAARDHRLPQLVRLSDIRADLHMHTLASDGRNSIQAMANAAVSRGYSYIAVTDHSASHGFGNDVQPDQLRRQIEAVRELDAALEDITVLCGSEVNILSDGSLDYDDDLLSELDWVIASLHSAFRMPEGQMTARLISAVEHPLVDAIGHPTGRLINRRNPYALDIEAVIDACAANGTLIEINANPNRRDLDEVYARLAAQRGVGLLINSDAHGADTLQNIYYGLATARRAWLTAADIANTRTLPEFLRLCKHSKNRASAR